ncbi:MAG: NYN domain-containing protein [Treponema sp.]|nr:NYN domain-containing protein [Treponema sp.]
MNSTLASLVRIGIFYDGYYFYKVSNYYKYEHPKKARISISGLHDFIRNEASVITGADFKQCQIVDAHYFKGRSSAREMGEKVQSERIFEDILMRENIITHYLPLRNGPNNTLQEKGIDVWLALEAYEMTMYKHFDIIALVVCDGDYVPLVRKLNTLGAHVMLISWDFDYYSESGRLETTRTSQQLLEEVYHPVCMTQIIENRQRDEFVKKLFVMDREHYISVGDIVGNKHLTDTVSAAAGAEDACYSTILNLKEGYGFIEDRSCNNIFFHFSTVENADFNDLKPGMKVKYYREEDEEKSKAASAPRYRATKVFLTAEADSRTIEADSLNGYKNIGKS